MDYTPPYGDLTEQNTCRDLMDAVGKELLRNIVKGYLDLLGTSAAAYEVNGDCATALFTSDYCRFLDAASRRLCGTRDNAEALSSGKWDCHESCWTQASKISIATAKPCDLRLCLGGIHIYAVPIISEGRVIGSLNFGYGTPPKDEKTLREIAERYRVDVEQLRGMAERYAPRPDYIVEVAKRQVETMAELVAGVYRHRQTEQALERRVVQLSALNTMAAIVNESLDVDEILDRAMEEALRLVGVEAAGMFLLDEKAGELAMVAHQGLSDEFIQAASRLKVHESLSGQVVQTGEPAVLADLAEYPWALKAYLEKEHIRSAAVVPLTGSTGVIGTMNLAASSPHYFDPIGLELLVALGRQIAIGVEKARLHEAVRESERRFLTFMEHLPGAAFMKDHQGRYLYLNETGAQVLGAKLEDWQGKTDDDVFPADVAGQVKADDHRVMTEGRSHRRVEDIPQEDGMHHWLTIKFPITDENGKPVILGGVAVDITERKQAEQRIQHLNAELEQRVIELKAVNQELEAFSYSVSHDLRAPLRAIDGFSRVLLEDYSDTLDTDGQRVLNIIRSSTQDMGQLIDDLLAFSRLSRKQMSRSGLDMNQLVQDVFDQLQRSTAQRRVRLNVQALPSARGDRAMMREVWANLLSNALKFTRPREVALIEVAGRVEGNETLYYVKDNGVGFDMKYVGKLFRVFQRLHSSEEFKGTGIGLSLVQRIIHRHGGRVWAEAKVDEGATFYFTLPRTKEREDGSRKRR